MENKFDLLLPSNVVSEKSGHVNTIGCYTTILPKPLVFESHDWVVGLRSISYTYSWFNIKDGDYFYLQRAARGDSTGEQLPFAVPKPEERISENIKLLPGRYESAEQIVKSIETKLSQLNNSQVAELPSLKIHRASSRLVVKTGKMKDDTPLSIWFSEDLGAMLGYENPIIIIHKDSLPLANQQRQRREASLHFPQQNLPFCDKINETREGQILLSNIPGTCTLRTEEEIKNKQENKTASNNKNQSLATNQQQTLQSADVQKGISQQKNTTPSNNQDNPTSNKETDSQKTSPTDQNRQDREKPKSKDPTPDTSGNLPTKKVKPNPEQTPNNANVFKKSGTQTTGNKSIDFSELSTPQPLVTNLGLPTPVLKGERRIDMNRGIYNMMVYSNVGDYMTVGDTRCQLLQSVEIPSKAKVGEQLVKRYDNPDYVPLHSLFIPSIEIEIKDDAGKPLEFEFGRVTVRLQFKKKEHLQSEYYGELLS